MNSWRTIRILVEIPVRGPVTNDEILAVVRKDLNRDSFWSISIANYRIGRLRIKELRK